MSLRAKRGNPLMKKILAGLLRRFSPRHDATILIFILAFSSSAYSWNEDYTQANFPSEKRVCLRKSEDLEKGSTIYIHSIDEDEGCDSEEENYQFILGKNPEGSFALIPFTDKSTYQDPKATNNQSTTEGFRFLYKFTCLGKQSFQILEAKASRYVFRGELFFSNEKQICSSAYETALKACKGQLGGVEVLEKC